MDLVSLFIEEKISIYDFCKKYDCEKDELIKQLKDAGFLYAKPGAVTKLIINLKYASDEYLMDDRIQAQEICKKYGLNHNTFSKYMKEYVKIPIRARKISNFNDCYFDSIDTEDKAYLLGFFYVDGYISSSPIDEKNPKNIYTIELSIQLRDKEILDLMKEKLQTPRPILIDDKRCSKDGTPWHRCRLIVNSMHMWNTLNNYGCTPRKSLTVDFPDESIFIESNRYSKEELIRHFIRGYFDGDGCISYTSKLHNKPNIQLLGTESFLRKVLKYVPEELKNLTLRHNHCNEEEIEMFFNTSCNKAKVFLHYLYNNSTIYLNRKYERFTALCCSNTANEEDKVGEDCDVNPEVIS